MTLAHLGRRKTGNEGPSPSESESVAGTDSKGSDCSGPSRDSESWGRETPRERGICHTQTRTRALAEKEGDICHHLLDWHGGDHLNFDNVVGGPECSADRAGPLFPNKGLSKTTQAVTERATSSEVYIA